MTREEILKRCPDIKEHHEYCMEMYLNAIENRDSWRCMCDVLRKYDEYEARRVKK